MSDETSDHGGANGNGAKRWRRPATPTIVRLAAHENNFLLVDKSASRDARLSFRAVGLHTYLLGLPDDWRIRVDQLAKVHRDGRDGIRAGLDELRAAGYADLRCVRDAKGKVVGWDWIIFETPALAAEPETEIPDLDEPEAEKPDVGSDATGPDAACPDLAQPDLAQPDLANPLLLRTVGTEDLPTDLTGSAALRPAPVVLPHAAGRAGVVEAIYQAYPRKRKPKPAKAAILKALRELDARGLPPAGHGTWADWLPWRTGRYAAEREGIIKAGNSSAGYTPYPATWFNAGSYDDDDDEETPQASNGGGYGRTLAQKGVGEWKGDVPGPVDLLQANG